MSGYYMMDQLYCMDKINFTQHKMLMEIINFHGLYSPIIETSNQVIIMI